MTPDLAFVEALAREAGAELLRHFGNLEKVEKKGSRDLVTAADRASEALVIAAIRRAFPDDTILAEETASDERRAPRLWVVDPLDGTTNFVQGLHHFAVSIAFLAGGTPRLACVFNPLLDECYTAARGQGASKNGRAIRASAVTSLADAVLGTGFAYRREELPDSNVQHVEDFAFRVRDLRRLGSAALDLCYVAEGRLDGFWELHLAPWDVAAGALIATESGALVTAFDGGPDWLFGRTIVAAPAPLHAAMREVLRAADPARLPGPRYRAPAPASVAKPATDPPESSGP